MASEKILNTKKTKVEEIENKIKNATSVVFFDYRGLTDTEIKTLRNKLKEDNNELKVYKNTLVNLALKNMNIDVEERLVGPKAIVLGDDMLSPIKAIYDFAKTSKLVEIKFGIVDGELSETDKLNELATIPSREGLLTMLAGGMIAIPKDLAISLNLLMEQKQ